MNIRSNWSHQQSLLEKQALAKLKPDVTERYKRKHSLSELQVKLDRFCEDRGVQLHSEPEQLQKMTLSGRGLEKMKGHACAAIDSLIEDEADRRDVKNFLGRYSDNLRTAFYQKNGRHMNAADAYKLMVKNVAKLALQEHAATETLLGHHGIEHIVTHNMRVAQSLFDRLQEQGLKVSAKDRVLLDQAMIDHDIGYALVADEIRAQGLRGQDAGHAVIGARLARESRESSVLNSVFEDPDWTAYHQAILYHGAPHNSHIAFQLTDGSDSTIRNKNIEVAVRLADTSHGLDEHKLPPLILDHPETLACLRLLQAAGELGREDLIKKTKGVLAKTIEDRKDLSPAKKAAFLQAAQQAAPISAKFLVGRFEGNSGQSELVEGSQLTLLSEPNPIRDLVYDFFGFENQGKQLAKIQEETGATALDSLRVKLKDLPLNDSPKSNFQGEVRELLLKTPIAGFHRLDSALARSGCEEARAAHLEQYLSR